MGLKPASLSLARVDSPGLLDRLIGVRADNKQHKIGLTDDGFDALN